MARVKVTKYARELRSGDQIECEGAKGTVALAMHQTGGKSTIWLSDGRLLTLPAKATARVELTDVGITL